MRNLFEPNSRSLLPKKPKTRVFSTQPETSPFTCGASMTRPAKNFLLVPIISAIPFGVPPLGGPAARCRQNPQARTPGLRSAGLWPAGFGGVSPPKPSLKHAVRQAEEGRLIGQADCD